MKFLPTMCTKVQTPMWHVSQLEQITCIDYMYVYVTSRLKEDQAPRKAGQGLAHFFTLFQVVFGLWIAFRRLFHQNESCFSSFSGYHGKPKSLTS